MTAAPPPDAAPELTGIVGWVVDLMETLGAPGVGLAIALENLFPPLPSEVFLPLAGFAAARGDLGLGAAIVWTTLGSVVGAIALYGLGAALGRDRLRAIVDRMPLVDVADVDKAEAWFARHGPKAVFFGRMVPLVRSMISVPAGVERMSFPLFVALTAAGSLIWNSVFVLAGYLLGENWHVVEGYAGIFSRLVLVAVGVAVVVFVVRRILRRRRAVPAGSDAAAAASASEITVRIPVVPPTGAPPAPPWSARPPSADWSDRPTERIPVVAPGYAPPPAPRPQRR